MWYYKAVLVVVVVYSWGATVQNSGNKSWSELAYQVAGSFTTEINYWNTQHPETSGIKSFDTQDLLYKCYWKWKLYSILEDAWIEGIMPHSYCKSSSLTMCWWDKLHTSDHELGSLWSPKMFLIRCYKHSTGGDKYIIYKTWSLPFDTWQVCVFLHIFDEPRCFRVFYLHF